MSRPAPHPVAPPGPEAHAVDDAEILALGRRIDEAHAAWLRTVEAHREPAARYAAIIEGARARGDLSEADYAKAEAVSGWKQSSDAETDAFVTLGEMALQALRSMPLTVSGLAVLARAAIPHVWATGSFEEDAPPGGDETIDRQALRYLIDACLSLGGVDWKGNPAGAWASAPTVSTTKPAHPSAG